MTLRVFRRRCNRWLFFGALCVCTLQFFVLLNQYLLHAEIDDLSDQPLRLCNHRTENDLVTVWDFMRQRDNDNIIKQAVIVVGLESSGSKVAALSAADILEYPKHVHTLWSAHGARAGCFHRGGKHFCTSVVHRSLPHGSCFPQVDQLVKIFHEHNFHDVKLIVATRDKTISSQSKAWTHQSNPRVANLEQHLAVRQLASLIIDPPVPAYVFSYESYMMLGQAYMVPLLAFLDKPAGWIDRLERGPIEDGNKKRICGFTLLTGLLQLPRAFFSRQSAVMTKEEARLTRLAQHRGRRLQEEGAAVQVGEEEGAAVQVGEEEGAIVQVGEEEGAVVQVGEEEGAVVQVEEMEGSNPGSNARKGQKRKKPDRDTLLQMAKGIQQIIVRQYIAIS
jgi:hypothetical protein